MESCPTWLVECVGADESLRPVDECPAVGVLICSEERYVGGCVSVMEQLADHVRDLDVAVVGGIRQWNG